MKRISTILAAGCLALSSFAASQPNVLFIAIDDLRPELGCYGSEIAISPNLDKLASQGLLFNRAYCQEAICGPSRASLMSGMRPDSNRVVENSANLRELNPDLVTLSQHFIANGYEAVQIGKIYHNLVHSDPEFSWSRDPARIKLKKPYYPYALKENRAIQARNKKTLEAKYGKGIGRTGIVQGPAYEFADVADTEYRDGYNAQVAIATLKEMLQEDKPFFLGMGFYKPHLDFIAPKRYWDMYDHDDIPLATQVEGPKDGAAMGLHASFELRVRDGIPKSGDIDDELARNLKHAYLACVTYIDAQIGLVIEALEEAGVRDNTIIIVWGDHGWHLGDMGIWGKATNYEIATRVPMMIWTPDMPAGSRGKTTDALVELVDIYPTLTELAGLPMPDHLEGTSFTPLLADPSRPWEAAAFSQFPDPALREWAANPLSPGMRETFFGPLIQEVEGRIIEQQGEKWDRDLFENRLMGYTMRTDRYRLVVWKDVTNPTAEPVFVELYDHDQDANETVNIAKDNAAIVEELLKQFDAGWQGSRPTCCAK
ncbi:MULTISPECIES: sulfatase [unclassified Lentimonas]|uniref:sulfatase n=1 Tax=unclassified Lentimonas TaxID=2630993 RepID=UPI001326606F|nr:MULTISPECIES: sulfatase [unclassified Lentimonas]CAA6690692.1 Choline-sulfatase (EC [Lentimonas sp. CC19]CAA6693371.1 Choline-sulfatase (EC [Lentimonas sp. CC10]CAA7071844.1 Choline-sulfatase (EC [Lentimonas sp. CC11]